MPRAQILYGEVVYWLCVVSALLCMVGPFFALINPKRNLLNPHYLFSSIWAGYKADAIWLYDGPDWMQPMFQGLHHFFGVGGFQGGHFWLNNITSGDGLTQFGLVLGCSVALPSLLVAAVCYLTEKPRQYLWAILGVWVSFLITFSAIGIMGAGH
jgi:uncharacterized membrane protein